MATFPTNPVFGETTALRIRMADSDGATFTISSATVTIKDTSGTAVRSAVEATVEDATKRVYYIETFSTANGYAEGAAYTATFKVVTSDGYTEKFEASFIVLSANDE